MKQTSNDKTLTNSKLDDILEKVKKYKISPYEVGNNTTLTVTGVQKIFDGETKKPGNKSISIISDYITRVYEPETIVKEQQSVYGLNDEVTLAKILLTLERLETKIDAHNLKQEIMFEIIKNAKAKELEHLDKEFNLKIRR